MEVEGKQIIRVGSRKSELALIQTNYVIDSLQKVHPDKKFTIVTMDTLGDRILNVSLPKIGEKSLFTKDLEDALRNDTVDFVVHSLKDLPTTLPDGLAVGAIFEREDPRDAVVLRENLSEYSLATLPAGSVVGTSSLRRAAQLRCNYPQLAVADVRGNLNTRLRKLDAEGAPYAALLLASAGLGRMNWAHRVSEVLPCSRMLYAVGQGALAAECRADDAPLLAALAPFNHAHTYCRALAERSFLKALGGGCSAPVGVSTSLTGGAGGAGGAGAHRLRLTGGVWSLDGAVELRHTLEQTFALIKKTTKHKLSPTDEADSKKVKLESDDTSNKSPCNPIEELNQRISQKSTDSNCEDVRSTDDIQALKKPRIFCGLTENLDVPLDVIEKCDKLGKDLAECLIAKGALDVMKASQDYIRGSTAKS